jgi:hypothetical protein
MSWPALSKFVEWTVAIWFAGVGGAVLFRLVTGAIPTGGMLKHVRGGSEPFHFHRLQLLAVTLMMAAGYLILALGRHRGDGLPDVPPPVLLAVAGSHLTYLGNKFSLSRNLGGGTGLW